MYCSSSNYSTLQSSDCSKTNNASNNCIQYSSVIGMSWLLYPNSSFQVLIDGVVYILWLSSRKEIGVNTKVALASNSNANSLYWSTVDTTNQLIQICAYSKMKLYGICNVYKQKYLHHALLLSISQAGNVIVQPTIFQISR